MCLSVYIIDCEARLNFHGVSVKEYTREAAKHQFLKVEIQGGGAGRKQLYKIIKSLTLWNFINRLYDQIDQKRFWWYGDKVIMKKENWLDTKNIDSEGGRSGGRRNTEKTTHPLTLEDLT